VRGAVGLDVDALEDAMSKEFKVSELIADRIIKFSREMTVEQKQELIEILVGYSGEAVAWSEEIFSRRTKEAFKTMNMNLGTLLR
jgi:hypothetical protein